MLEFDWDDDNLGHIAEHDVTAAEAEHVLENPTLDVEYQDWHEEERFAEVGITALGRVLVVVTTWRELQIRVVTAYDAPADVAEEYLRTR
jgi:uncharacterized DUF497 family protein